MCPRLSGFTKRWFHHPTPDSSEILNVVFNTTVEVYVSRFVMGLAEAFYALCLDESSVQDETSSALDFCALYFLSMPS